MTPKLHAMNPANLPDSYVSFLEEEHRLLLPFLDRTSSLLDVGCGSGRIIPSAAQRIREYHGVDNDPEMIRQAQYLFSEATPPNYSPIRLSVLEASTLAADLGEDRFDLVVALFNTLGNFSSDETGLAQMGLVSRSNVLFTVLARGAIQRRKEYYDAFGIEYHVNATTETFYSGTWGISRAYTPEQIQRMSSAADLQVRNIISIADQLGYFVHLAKDKRS